MKELLEYSNKKLIKKYDHFYIRFIGGQYVELPCDVKITEQEAEKIMNQHSNIVDILDEYRKIIPWSIDTFVRRGLEEYLYNEENYSKQEISNIMNRLDRHESIKYEMYESIMTEAFPVNGLVQVQGKTAKKLSEDEKLSIGKAYLILLGLKDKE